MQKLQNGKKHIKQKIYKAHETIEITERVCPKSSHSERSEGIFKFQWFDNKKITCLQQAGFFVPHRNDVV